MKKKIGFLFSGILLCLLFSMTALATQGEKDIESERIWLTVTRPIPGKMPGSSMEKDVRSYMMQCSMSDGTIQDRDIELKKVQWQAYNATKGKWEDMSSKTFEKGVKYRIKTTFLPKEGLFYGVDDNTSSMDYKGSVFVSIYDPLTKEKYTGNDALGRYTSFCVGTDKAIAYGNAGSINSRCLIITFEFPVCQSEPKASYVNSEDKAFELGRYESKDVKYKLKWNSIDLLKEKKKYQFETDMDYLEGSVLNTGLFLNTYSKLGTLKFYDQSVLHNAGMVFNNPKYGTTKFRAKIIVYRNYYKDGKYAGTKFAGVATLDTCTTMIRSKRVPYLQNLEMKASSKTGPLKVTVKNDSYYPITILAGTTAQLVKGSSTVELKTTKKVVIEPGKTGTVSYKIVKGNFKPDTTGYTLKTNWKWNGASRKFKLRYDRIYHDEEEYYSTETNAYFYDQSKWIKINDYEYDDEY